MWVYHGVVDLAEVEAANAEFYNSEKSDRASYQLVDTSRIEEFVISKLDFKKVAAVDVASSQVNKKMKVAVVATNPDVISNTEDYIDTSRRLNSTWEIKIFSEITTARDWIHQ